MFTVEKHNHNHSTRTSAGCFDVFPRFKINFHENLSLKHVILAERRRSLKGIEKLTKTIFSGENTKVLKDFLVPTYLLVN